MPRPYYFLGFPTLDPIYLINLPIYIPLMSHSGWWLTYPSEKYESVGMMTFPTEWENKIHVPNHQPAFI
jgi:hypothetical protein